MTTTLGLARQLLGLTPSTRQAAKPTACGSSPTGLDGSGFEVSLSSFGEDVAILLPACPGRRAVNRWPLPDSGYRPAGKCPLAVRSFRLADGRRASLWPRIQRYESTAIAAFAVACVHQREAILAGRGAVLLITGGEETGCDGARR